MPPLEKTYTPNSDYRPIYKFIAAQWTSIWNSRYLAARLAIRDISSRYRQTAFGIAWILLTPLATTAIFVLLKNTKIVNVPDSQISYPVFVMFGSMVWQLFSSSINAPLRALSSGRSIMTKVNFPQEALLVASAIDVLVNFAIGFTLILIVSYFLGSSITSSILLVPIPLAILVLIGTTLGILLAPISFLYVDLSLGIPYVLNFLFLLTPIAYPMPKEGIIALISKFNPVAYLINAARDYTYLSSFAESGVLLPIAVVSVFCFVFALVFYRISIPILIERS